MTCGEALQTVTEDRFVGGAFAMTRRLPSVKAKMSLILSAEGERLDVVQPVILLYLLEDPNNVLCGKG